MAHDRVINPEALYDSTEYMFNQVVVDDGTVHVSGQIGTDADNVVVGDSFEDQAEQCFENIGVLLEELGKDYGDVTKIQSYIVDLEEHLPRFRGVWEQYYGDRPDDERPCHTTIGVDKLSHIAEGELLIELEFWVSAPEASDGT